MKELFRDVTARRMCFIDDHIFLMNKSMLTDFLLLGLLDTPFAKKIGHAI